MNSMLFSRCTLNAQRFMTKMPVFSTLDTNQQEQKERCLPDILKAYRQYINSRVTLNTTSSTNSLK